MTDLETLQLENLKLLRRRGRLFGVIIIGLVICLALLGLLYAQTAKVVRQNGVTAAQTRNYTRCLAEVFVESQDHKVTSLDLNRCSTTTEPNPVNVPNEPLQRPQGTTQGVFVPSRGVSGPQTGSQSVSSQSTPQPKQCTVNLLNVCL